MKVLLTPTPDFRRQYYGERALAGLRAIADVKLHEGGDALDRATRGNAGKFVTSTLRGRLSEQVLEITEGVGDTVDGVVRRHKFPRGRWTAGCSLPMPLLLAMPG